MASVLVEQPEAAALALVLELVARSAAAAALARVVEPAVSLAPVAVAPALQRIAQPAGLLVLELAVVAPLAAARAQVVLGPAPALVRVAEPAAYLAPPLLRRRPALARDRL